MNNYKSYDLDSTDCQVKVGMGCLKSIIVTYCAGNAITVYDSGKTSNLDQIILRTCQVTTTVNLNPVIIDFNGGVCFNNGLYIFIDGGAQLTVIYA